MFLVVFVIYIVCSAIYSLFLLYIIYNVSDADGECLHGAQVNAPQLVNERLAILADELHHLVGLHAAHYGRCDARHLFARMGHGERRPLVGEERAVGSMSVA